MLLNSYRGLFQISGNNRAMTQSFHIPCNGLNRLIAIQVTIVDRCDSHLKKKIDVEIPITIIVTLIPFDNKEIQLSHYFS